ncbi:sulfite exporter TauE/SafE family protein [Fluviicola sp.]|uniref:sulfite exporter TauE/SafE family protein n=1 Tax=Fluviicola sp. TaxID=1917219 RepID=UPI0031DF74B2
MIFLISSFILGLAGSFHCIGMCGPIALALPVNRKSPATVLADLLTANTGRIITYTLLGFVIGSIGFSLQLFRLFQVLSILFGLLLIAIAWRKQLLRHIEFRSPGFQKWVSGRMQLLLRQKGTLKLFGIGLLNGLLPCGMIFLALTNALLAENPLGSASAMAAFGLGTLPALIGVGFFAQRFNQSFRNRLTGAFPYLLSIIGLLVILRGANFGIPVLSPKIEQLNPGHPKSVIVECHQPEK